MFSKRKTLLLDDPYDREKLFLDKELVWLQKNFPNLKITLEHITTKEAIEYVKENKNIGNIATHHLLENTNSFLGDLLKPELFCKPIIAICIFANCITKNSDYLEIKNFFLVQILLHT